MIANFTRLSGLIVFLSLACGIQTASPFEIRAKATINTNQVTSLAITPQAFGANIVLNPSMGNPAYQQAMKDMDWPFLRVNGQDSLIGNTFYSRDAALGKVSPNWYLIDRMQYIPGFAKGQLLMTPGGPPDATRFTGWASAPFDILSSADQALYANMVTQIAMRLKALNVPITHWSMMNEPNIAWYSTKVSYPQLIQSTCTMAKLTYTALQKIDPSYIVGGPEFDFWGTNPSWLSDYLACAGSVTKFVSYHTYGIATEDKYNVQSMIKGVLGLDPNNKRTYKNGAQAILTTTQNTNPNIPMMITEYNMNGDWQPTDPAQATVTGAVYDALAISQAVLGGVSSMAIWEAFNDQTFGVIDSNYQKRPAAYILKAMRQSLPGRIVTSNLSSVNTGQALNATLIATTNQARTSIMIVNFDNVSDLQVQMSQTPQSASHVDRYELSPAYPYGTTASIASQDLDSVLVPANSVVILTLSPTHSNRPKS